jgi:hypothetical protein
MSASWWLGNLAAFSVQVALVVLVSVLACWWRRLVCRSRGSLRRW